jgi:hypothetical protein
LGQCKAYIAQYKLLVAESAVTVAEKKYCKELLDLIPLLQKAQRPVKKENSIAEFHDLYKSNFDYLNKFTKVTNQKVLKTILTNPKMVLKLERLYKGIYPETLKRQEQILAPRKKEIAQWKLALEKQLQTEEIQKSLEGRFQELLRIANASLVEKGLASISFDKTQTT